MTVFVSKQVFILKCDRSEVLKMFVIHSVYRKRRGKRRKKFNFKIVSIKIPEPKLPLIPVVLDYVVVDVLALSQTHS